MNCPEEKWMDAIYGAAEAHFDRDPDMHHEMVAARMVSAALEKLAEIADEHGPRGCAKFIRSITI